MSTAERPQTIPSELLAEMQERADRASRGVRDPEDARRAVERMDRMREELRERVGETNVAVELVREIRDAE